MRLLIVRHGDPDYSIDSLTETGWREARLLADRMAKEDLTAIYASPLGRAKNTCQVTLDKIGRTATECPWLREFWAPIHRPDVQGRTKITWDWLPEDWTAEPRFFDKDHWFEVPCMVEGGVKQEYDRVTTALDEILAEHGYRRDGLLYRTEQGNHETLAFFCHFGVECVLLSHLLNISPMQLWHGTIATPSAVTELHTEERRRGKAYFRMSYFGDISHLYVAGEKPEFAGRFCECFEDAEDRHD